jgi:BON domain
VLLAPRSAAAPVKGLLAEVEQFRIADVRFREVRPEVSDGRVTLSGRVDDMETLIELGRAISRLPGVRHVDLRGVVIGR